MEREPGDRVPALVVERRHGLEGPFGHGLEHARDRLAPTRAGTHRQEAVGDSRLAQVVEDLPNGEPSLAVQPHAAGADAADRHGHGLQVFAAVDPGRRERVLAGGRLLGSRKRIAFGPRHFADQGKPGGARAQPLDELAAAQEGRLRNATTPPAASTIVWHDWSLSFQGHGPAAPWPARCVVKGGGDFLTARPRRKSAPTLPRLSASPGAPGPSVPRPI